MVFKGEVMLAGADKATAKFVVPDPNPFLQAVKERGAAGQRFQASFVPIQDDEEVLPVDVLDLEHTPTVGFGSTNKQIAQALKNAITHISYVEVETTEGPGRAERRPSNQAALLCLELGFQVFLGVRGEQEARAYVLGWCRVRSRAELDTSGRSRDRFFGLVSAARSWAIELGAE